MKPFPLDENPNQTDQLLARIAWHYYYEELTQAEIAAKLNLTRARVNKLLQKCRDKGLVRVQLTTPLSSSVELESRLVKRFGLIQAVVTPTPFKEAKLYQAIGRECGRFLSENLNQGQALGLGWGKTLRATIDYIPQRKQSNITVVSLFGGLPRSVTTNPYDIASLVARRVDAEECYYIAAPMFVSSREVRDTLMSQELFSRVFERAARVDLALVGAGDLSSKATNVVLGALTKDEWRSLLAAGAVGELFGYFLNAEGELVDHSLNQRIMAPNWQDMLNIPTIAMAAGGLQKVPILRAVLHQGYIQVLITDEKTAENILLQEEN